MTFLYCTAISVLCVLSLYRLFLVVVYYSKKSKRPIPCIASFSEWPFVTVQIPLYNEKFVAERVIRAACEMDYPRHRFEVQVLDDSTDDTVKVVRQLQSVLCFSLLNRAERTDYKAGALAEGLKTARGEFVAVFDADFIPPCDFLKKTVPYFQDLKVGVVQGRWSFLNATDSLVTRLQWLYLNAHFTIEHFARSLVGGFFHFNGSAGIWRRVAIEDAGGWRGLTLTEDLDLSYRAHLKGWKFIFLSEVSVPSELPVSIPAMQSQQFRWAKGMSQVARIMLVPLWRAKVPLWKKIDGTMHLLSPLTYATSLIAVLSLIPYFYFRSASGTRVFEEGIGTVLVINLLWSVGFYLISEKETGTLSWRRVIDIFIGIPLGIAFCVNGTRALVSGLRSDGGEFVRTPKRGEEKSGRWYESLSPLSLTWEFVFSVFFILALFMPPFQKLLNIWPVVIFGFGFWYLSFDAIRRIYLRTFSRAK